LSKQSDNNEYFSLFVPVYNEEDILEENINEIYSEVSSITDDFKIYIVDDNSNDDTAKVAKRICKKNPKLVHLRYDFGPTRRENLGKSFPEAGGKIIAFMDLDLATDLKHTGNLLKEIEAGADISIGSRYLKSSSRERRVSRHLISIIFNTVIRILFRSRIRDHECGFKSFRRKIILDLLSELGYDNTLKRSVFWDAELLIRAQRRKYKIVEFPIDWFERQKSALNFGREKSMVRYILRMKGGDIKDFFSKKQ
jgi:glycosyltransferase involved in cell wall biosynthesis